MNTTFRMILTAIVFFATYFFIYWLPLSLIPRIHEIEFLPQIISLLIALGPSVLVWKKMATTSNSLALYIMMGGIIVGAIGFILGFLGPIIFKFGGNQGPLLGIFITGPAGFLIGLIGGALYWFAKRKSRILVV